MSVSDARAALPRILEYVEDGEEVALTRHGRTVAVVVRPDLLRARRAGEALGVADSLRSRIGAGRARALDTGPGVTEARARVLVADLRAGRDRS